MKQKIVTWIAAFIIAAEIFTTVTFLRVGAANLRVLASQQQLDTESPSTGLD